jgi:hypothetical protein
MLATGALISAGMATAIGYLAPWWPRADIPNHFTPFIIAVAVGGLALLTVEVGNLGTHRRVRLALAVGLAGVAAVNTGPLFTALATTAFAAQGPTETLTVVSFNVWSKNQRLDEVSRWLLRESRAHQADADGDVSARPRLRLQRYRDVLAQTLDGCWWSAAHGRTAGNVLVYDG